MNSTAAVLAEWAYELRPEPKDHALADRSLLDTIAVTLAARDHPLTVLAAILDEGGYWAAAGHVLDFDDLHLQSTTHISAICVPVALATGGGPRAYLAAAGVMARLGRALGWPHYSAGWHATCTAGAPAAAAGAAVAMGLDPARIARAIALAVPAAGGVQRAFGADAKSLQVGFAVDAGIRAARLAAAGASADDAALDTWLHLAGAADSVDLTGPVVPHGLAIKMYPCCYALQRPISAIAELVGRADLEAADVQRIQVSTPQATVVPLVHHRPNTGLEGKFSLEYAVAAALLDRHPSFTSFTDPAVRRESARRLVGLVDIELRQGGSGLLDGELHIKIHLGNGAVRFISQKYPPGSPEHPPTVDQLSAKLADCVAGLDTKWSDWTWSNAADVLRQFLPRHYPVKTS